MKKFKKKAKWIITVAMVLCMAITVGCSAGLITASEAKEIALSDANVTSDEANFVRTDLDDDDGLRYYDLEFRVGNTEYDYEINAENGNIISKDSEIEANNNIPATSSNTTNTDASTTENNSTANSTDTNTSSDIISENEAKNIALEHAGVSSEEATFTRVESDLDDGIRIYEVDFRVGNTEYDYEINAETGDIISSEKDIDD